jgi:hypothetical protein
MKVVQKNTRTRSFIFHREEYICPDEVRGWAFLFHQEDFLLLRSESYLDQDCEHNFLLSFITLFHYFVSQTQASISQVYLLLIQVNFLVLNCFA